MRKKNPRLFRLSASVAIGALLCNAIPPAAAQPGQPPQPDQTPQSGQTQVDPPTRVGRIASETGAVSFRTAADTQWSTARTNFPVSSGDAFWTEPTARADLEISASRVSLAGQTEFDVTTLDDSGLQAVEAQGEVYLRVADPGQGETWSVQTPRGTVHLNGAGRYDIVAGTTEQPTLVTVVAGSAQIEGPGVSLTIATGQTATVTGSGPFQGNIGPAEQDAFLTSRLPAQPSAAALPVQLTYMSGAEDLSGVGEWAPAPDYGEVWYPPVAATWVPYQDGNWAYVAPWGWTWIDSAPWGFAPFHYGRWAHIGDRWGWVPGDRPRGERPVYAPALVAFVGLGVGAAALAHGRVGWVPLGPHEAYHPWYRSSAGYDQRINRADVKDLSAIGNRTELGNLVNRGAARSVPASVMLRSGQVRTVARPIPQQAFASAHMVVGQQPISPSVRTFGVTPAVARQLALPPGPGALRPAPGPVVRAQAVGPSGGPLALPGPRGEPSGAPRPGELPGLPRTPGGPPPLPGPRGELPGAPRPGEPTGPGLARTPGGPPPLPAPGARPEGIPSPRGNQPAIAAPPGIRPSGPESGRPPGGVPPLPAPGERPVGAPGPHAPPRPEGPGQLAPERLPAEHQPAVARPAPEVRPVPDHAPAPVRAEPPRPAGPPPRVEAPRPAAPPPRVEAPHPAAPPPRPAAPPPRAEPPRQVAPPPRAAPPPAAPPPRPAAPPPPRPAPPPPHAPEKKPGQR
jgi:hypothetical protein